MSLDLTIQESQPFGHSKTNIPPLPPVIQANLEEIKTIFLDKIQNLVDERTFASDLITYASKWEYLTTSLVPVFQDLKDVSSESLTFVSKRQKLLEAKLAFVAANQEAMAIKQT